MKFSPEFIERVAEANNLVSIISQYTQLKPSGGGFMGRCPFPDHAEKTPSFSVSEMKQLYHCFGCKKKGNIFTFLKDYNGMSFPESIEYLANRANIAMPTQDDKESSRQDVLSQKKKAMERVNKLANQYFHENFKKLPNTHPAKIYATKRKLTAEIIETFQIGYASEEWDGLIQFLESKSVPMPLAEEARLVKARSDKSGYFDIFRDRLMFPIFSTMGVPIAFGGRILEKGEPKYLNSPETLVFHKGRVLYGLSETAKYIRTEDQAIVVEGYMDLIALYQAGFRNVVASMGTAFTQDHSRLLHRMTKNVVVLFDGDQAGQVAAERSLPILLSGDVYPKGLTLPDNQDPDDFVKANGAETLSALIAKAPDLFSSVLEMWMQGYRGEASEKVRLATQLQPIFQSIQDTRLKALYLSEAAQKLNVDEKWLRQAIISAKSDARFPSANTVGSASNNRDANVEPKKIEVPYSAPEDQIQLKGVTNVEGLLLGLALKNHANFSLVLESDIIEDITHSGVRELLKRAAEVYRQAPEKFDRLSSLLVSFVDHPELLITEESEAESDDSKLMLDCFRKVKEQKLATARKSLTLDLKNNLSGDKHQELMKALMDLKKEEMDLRTKGFTLKKKSSESVEEKET
jgi:DNA primase